MPQAITLTSATRTNLLSLQNTQNLINQTQQRLATGLKVNSPLDNALAYFEARDLNDRASDLLNIKNNISDGINVVQAAVQGLDSMESMLQQMQALAQSAISAPDSMTRAKLASQFNALRSQVDGIAEDSSYHGVNLLKNTTSRFAPGADQLTVKFNNATQPQAINQVVISGLTVSDYRSIMGISALTTLGSNHAGPGNTLVWGQTGAAAIKAINFAISSIESALTTVRAAGTGFGTNASLLQIREDFTAQIVNTLQGGASGLVNADMNEESANLLSLQTRQQLGTISLSIAQQSQQAILQLFG